MAEVAVYLLGPFQLTIDGRPVTGFKSDRVRALLAYLAAESDRPQPRGRLACLLWPDLPDRVATRYLRDVLANLRRVLGDRAAGRESRPPCLLVSGDTIQLNLAAVRVDVHEMLARLGEPPGGPGVARRTAVRAQADLANIETAVGLYRGPFLESFSFGASVDFEEWAIMVRERLRLQVLTSLRLLVNAHTAAGSIESALAAARRLLEIEPWDEEAHRQVMRLLVRAGRPGSALEQYELCRASLAREFGVAPARETTALFESIRRHEASPPGERRPDGVSPTGAAEQERRPLPPPGLHVTSSARLPPVQPLETPPAARAAPFNAFVARQAEMQWLGRRLHEAMAGRGQVLLVTGEAGSGKTRLLAEFREHVMPEDAHVLIAEGQCNNAAGAADAYLPFREIAAMLTADVESQRAAGAVTPAHAGRLWAALPEVAELLAQQGPDLINRLIPGATLVGRLQDFARSASGISVERLASIVSSIAGPAAPGAPGAAATRLTPSGLNGQYTAWLRAVSLRYPLVLLVDDVQWADNPTLDLLFHLGRRLAGARILIVAAYRAGDVALGEQPDGRRHPLELIANELVRAGGDIRLDLNRCPGQRFVEELLDSEAVDLPPSFSTTLYERTEGQPLFTVELLRDLHERGTLVRDANGCWSLSGSVDWEHLPTRVQAAIAERLARLPAPWQELLTIASIQGEEFGSDVTARVLNLPMAEVRRTLAEDLYELALVRPHRIISAGEHSLPRARYRFQHDFYRRYLYDRMDPVLRAAAHRSVAAAIEALHGGQVAEAAGELAWHYEEAGLPDRAAEWLLLAGRHATRVGAYRQAVMLLRRGLGLLDRIPQGKSRARHEAALRLGLSAPLMALGGWAAPERAAQIARAAEIGLHPDEGLLTALALFYEADDLRVHGHYSESQAVGEELLALALDRGDRAQELLAHFSLGFTGLVSGDDPAAALRHLQQAAHAFDGETQSLAAALIGAEVGPVALSWAGAILWMKGRPDTALAHLQDALDLAEKSGTPLTIGGVLLTHLWLSALFLDDTGAVRLANARLLEELGAGEMAVFRGVAGFMEGWLAAKSGCFQAGLAQMREGLAHWHSGGLMVGHFMLAALLANVSLETGHWQPGLEAVDEALGWPEKRGPLLMESELLRVRGDLLRAQAAGSGTEIGAATGRAEECIARGLARARQQGLKLFELRAACSQYRLSRAVAERPAAPLDAPEKASTARAALAEVYARFTEGFDTPDLVAARALLDAC